MANDYVDSVPLEQAGTGSAYILPQSQAINSLNNYIDATANDRKAALALKAKQAADTAAAWKANQLKIKGGTIYQPEINKRAAAVMQMGLSLQKAGINPNLVSNDPQKQQLVEQYQAQKAALLSDVDTRDAIAKQAQAHEKAIQANPAGYYDPASIDQYHKFIDGSIPLSEITAKGYQMPELKRAFNLEPILDKLQGVPIETTSTRGGIKTKLVLPNEIAHAQIANNLVKNNPEVQADISNKAGMNYADIPNTTDPDAIKKQIDDFYRSAPNFPALIKQGITSYFDPKYDQMITAQAKQVANAAKVKASYIDNIKSTLDNKVHTSNDKSYDFAYNREMREREDQGMQRVKYGKWLSDQQNESGQFNLGNQSSYVPVIKTNQKDGKQGASFVEPEQGASLYGVNLPQVKTVVRPSLVTDMKSGKTIKNTQPMEVAVSQIQMVPVFKGLSGNDPRNGSEISARQLKEIVNGKHPFAKLQNITFQPYAYGIRTDQNADGKGHTVATPVKFSYDALKGSNVKKINTATFDNATEQLKQLQANPKFQSMAPQDQLEFISKKYNIKLPE